MSKMQIRKATTDRWRDWNEQQGKRLIEEERSLKNGDEKIETQRFLPTANQSRNKFDIPELNYPMKNGGAN